ncbi:MAG: transposase [Candidatus Thiodiazotropha sp.]
MNWVRHHGYWTRNQWNTVLFTDESRYCLHRIDRRARIYRRRGERFADACVNEVDRFGGGSVMVWGGISFSARTQLIIVHGNLTGQRYRDEILAPVVAPFFNANRNVTILQQDNARCHTARISVDFIRQQHNDILPWPARSPDLSPIEHMWDALDRRVRLRQPQTLRQLRDILVQEWNLIPQQQSRTLLNSMRRRCTAVRNANGGHTSY